jgi:hypothetical protein
MQVKWHFERVRISDRALTGEESLQGLCRDADSISALSTSRAILRNSIEWMRVGTSRGDGGNVFSRKGRPEVVAGHRMNAGP